MYGSLDRKTWEKIGEKTSTAASTESGDTYTFDGDRLVSWIRLKGVESNVNNSFHIAENQRDRQSCLSRFKRAHGND